jgi:thiol-disulfide isomerase/thioredoxin
MLGNMQERLYALGGSKKIILILLLVAIFIGVAFYIYKTYITPKVNPSYVENKEILSDEAEKEAVLYFFYTTWCPHCKSAKPEWQKIKEEYHEKSINNTRVLFREVDCDKEDKVADEFNVEGYPTIKLVKDGQIIEYDAKPNYETLVQFLNTTL